MFLLSSHLPQSLRLILPLQLLCNFFFDEILVSKVLLVLIKSVTHITRVSSKCPMKIFFYAFKIIKLQFFIANEFVPCVFVLISLQLLAQL
jgi:hypothetical protein